MSVDPLSVRYSDVRHADQDLDMSSFHKSPNSSSSFSVSDARRRYEQLSASTTQVGAKPLPVRPPPRPSKAPVKQSQSTSTGMGHSTSDNRIHRGQRSPDHAVTSPLGNSRKAITTPDQEVKHSVMNNGEKSKSKGLKLKGSVSSNMDKTSGSRPDTPGSDSGATGTGDSTGKKLTSATKKLFKRISMEKGKVEGTREHASTNGSKGDSPSMSPSSSRKKATKEKVKAQNAGSSSPATSPTKAHPGDLKFRRSFSDQVLASPNQEVAVHTTLKREGQDGNSGGKIVGGIRPTSPRVIEDKELKINLTEDMTPLTGAELKAILSKQYAYISGGLENGKHLIITFPDVGLRQLESSESFSELLTTLVYFKTLISVQHLGAGFTLLLDAHSSKTHSSSKQILERMAGTGFPLSIHMVYIFMKAGLFGRNKSLASSEVTSKLHVACFADHKSLVEQLGAENLTPELGGILQYDHNTWVTNRLEFEKVQVLHRHAMTSVPEVTEALNVCSVPGTVKEAEQLMQEDLKLKENLVNKITEAELNIDNFLSDLNREDSAEGVELGGSSSSGSSKDYVTMREAMEGMLVDLRTSLNKFDAFWQVHKARVDHMMRMCHFKRTAGKLEEAIASFTGELTSGGIHLGDSLESSLELGEKHEFFVTKIKIATEEEVNRLREDADILSNPHFSSGEISEQAQEATKSAVENVTSTLDQLNSSYNKLTTMCQQKRDLFIVCVKFHMTTRQCTQWSQDVLEFLASQPMESPSYKQANFLIGRIDDFLFRVQPIQIQSLQELAAALPEEKVLQKSVQKSVQKYEHSCDLLNKRKADLLKVMTAISSPHPSKKDKKKHKDKEKPEIELLNSHEPLDDTVSVTGSIQSSNPEASLYLTKTMAGGGASDEVDGETNEATLKSRGFVFRELLATEQDYIKDLKTIIDSYYDAMDESETMPLRLRGKRNVIFGNLPEIYQFHDAVFAKALEQFVEYPQRVGEIFNQFNEEFQMYSVYCKNRSNSEALLSEQTENEAFFRTIQINLAHQLPLNSYLLKPVQRITKYQLLLKDMMKHSKHAPKAHADLQRALDRMLKVLKNLNDSLHVVGLKGFPGALAEQGRLLIHDAFHVLDGQNPSRSLFARAKERHVFLFEKVVIMSKKFEAPSQKKARKADNYLYKAHLPLADIALRATIDSQPLQFSLTMHGQSKDYRFQAQTKEIHSMWTCEIRRLLQLQFTLVKDMVIKSGTLDRRTYKGKAKLSRDSRLFGDSFKAKPNEVQSKKSISNRFKMLKRKKASGSDLSKVKKAGDRVNPEASLLTSCSVPPNVKFGLKGSGSPLGSISGSLTQSQASIMSDSSTCTSQRKLSESLSSDDDEFFSDDEDVGTAAVDHYESLAPGAPRHYMAIASYSPGGSEENGVALVLDQQVEVIGINQYGWWWVRATNPTNGEMEEGWVPASYLKVTGMVDTKS